MTITEIDGFKRVEGKLPVPEGPLIDLPRPGETYRHHDDPATEYTVLGYGFDVEAQCLTIRYAPTKGLTKREHLSTVGAGEYHRKAYVGTKPWCVPLPDGSSRFIKVP